MSPGIIIAIVVVVILVVAVGILAYLNTRDTVNANANGNGNGEQVLTPEEQCDSAGAYWDANTSQCFAEPPPEVGQVTPQELCESEGRHWDTASSQCMSAPPTTVQITNTSTLASGGSADPRIACLSGGRYWDENTNSCADIPPPTPTVQITDEPAPAPAPTGPGPVTGQYVRIERVADSSDTSPDKNVINLAEIAAYGPNGQSLMSGATIEAGSLYYGMYPPANLIDLNTGSFASTMPGGSPYTNIWYELNLGMNKQISEVVVTNRTQCCKNRATGLRLVITNAAGDVVYTSNPISTVQNVYTFDTIV